MLDLPTDSEEQLELCTKNPFIAGPGVTPTVHGIVEQVELVREVDSQVGGELHLAVEEPVGTEGQDRSDAPAGVEGRSACNRQVLDRNVSVFIASEELSLIHI